MTAKQTSANIFKDIPCIRPHAEKINAYLNGRRTEQSVLALYDRFVAFARWAQEVERQAKQDGDPKTVLNMPIDHSNLATYAKWLDKERGLAFSTIRGYISALGALHVAAEYLNPIWSEEVKEALAELRIKHADDKLQRARALSAAEFRNILSGIYLPRITRGGKMERREAAIERGSRDKALLLTMVEAGMRRSEAANLIWGEVREKEDGSGQVLLPVTWGGQDEVWVDITKECFEVLMYIKPEGVNDNFSVFNLSNSQIHRRLKRMCEEMGIDSTGISADTPRATLRRMLDEKPMTLEEYGRRLRLQSSKLARLYLDI